MRQITLDEYEANKLIEPKKVKRLKYYISLTAAYTKCPYCGAENPDEESYRHFPYSEKDIPLNYCYSCNKRFDTEVITIKTQAIKALEWYGEKTGVNIKGGVSDELIKKATNEYKKYLKGGVYH